MTSGPSTTTAIKSRCHCAARSRRLTAAVCDAALALRRASAAAASAALTSADVSGLDKDDIVSLITQGHTRPLHRHHALAALHGDEHGFAWQRVERELHRQHCAVPLHRRDCAMHL